MTAPAAAAPPGPRARSAPAAALALPRLDPGRASAELLAALSRDGDPVDAVVRAAAALAGAPAAALWRREGARLLLTHRVGDEAPADEAQAGPLTGPDRLDGAGAPGLPLELRAEAHAEIGPLALGGRPFAALPLPAAVLALGPLPGPRIGRTARRRLGELAGLAAAPVAQALRAAVREAELASLRVEAEMARRSLGSTIDENRSFGLLLELAMSSSGARAGFVAVRDGGRLRTAAARDLPPGFGALDLTPGAGVLAEVPGVPGLLVVEGTEALAALGVEGLLAVAGPAGAETPALVFGLIPDADCRLPADSAALLETIVAQAALVLESSQAARAAAGRHLAALRGLCRALDARSKATAGHHELVARAAGVLAARVGLPEAARRDVVAAASVHDVGLLAADATLAAEFAHPALGADMALLVPGAGALAPLIRAHHEWYDGFGFPNGLVGDAIPMGARVLAAAEFYVETLQAWGAEASAGAIADEVAARRGTQLDPRCADAMVSLLKEET